MAVSIGAHGGAAATTSDSESETRGWIQSPAFDLAGFVLVPLAGLLVMAATQLGRFGTLFIVACTFFVAIPHYLSSFTFFLGDDTLAYYRTRRLAFFAGPVVILSTVFALRASGMHNTVNVTMYVWNVWHVSLQSAGILSIYRRLNGGPAADRKYAHAAILAVGAAMAFWNIQGYPPLYDALHRFIPNTMVVIRAVGLSAALVALVVLAVRIARRARAISLAEGGFLATSLVLFHPYLWLRDANAATFAMLMGHFIQYLSIVWLVQRRKYAGKPGSHHQQLLGRVAGSPLLLGSALIGSGLVFYLAQRAAAAFGAPMAYIIIWNALTLVHFYLDGLIWAFRRPEVRDTLGRVLMPEGRVVLR